MICFQIVSLTYWFTAFIANLIAPSVLWFAFRLYLWHIGLQQSILLPSSSLCCDLLSDCIFDILVYSNASIVSIKIIVVICFQIVSLTYWFTAILQTRTDTLQLWFAFRLYLWHIGLQHWDRIKVILCGCDLLSDCIFDILVYSLGTFVEFFFGVVICFQIVSLTYWFTAISKISN